MKLLVLPLLVLTSAAAYAQSGVTVNEASQALANIEPAFAEAAGVKVPKRKISKDQQIMSRKQIAKEFERLFDLSKPHFRFTPRPLRFDAEIIRSHNDADTSKTLEKLAKWGLIGPVSPIVVSKNKGLTPKEFGDALSFCFLRLIGLTHMPDSKLSPDLMRGGLERSRTSSDNKGQDGGAPTGGSEPEGLGSL